MYFIKGKTINMDSWRTLAKAEDYKQAKELEIDHLRNKGFSWRIKVF